MTMINVVLFVVVLFFMSGTCLSDYVSVSVSVLLRHLATIVLRIGFLIDGGKAYFLFPLFCFVSIMMCFCVFEIFAKYSESWDLSYDAGVSFECQLYIIVFLF